MILSNLSLSGYARANSALCAVTGDEHPESTSHLTTLSPTGHLVVAVCLGFIGIFGFVNNLLVLVLYCRYKMLRTPINLLLINISLSDFLVCVVGTPFSFAASTQGRWLIGKSGCVWYGFINSLLGIVSLISLAVLSYERYATMLGPMEADSKNYRKVLLGVLLSWLYSLLWTLPPLVGWSRYAPEGPGTTCSVDWTNRSSGNISYILCLFIFCLLLPFMVIVFCYGKLLCAIRQVSGINPSSSRRREQRVLVMVVVMVVCYLMCWLPYGVMALTATFGLPGIISPEASIIPSLLAKTSTFINPIIYIFMNKQFHRCFRALFHCQEPQRGSSMRSSSKAPPKPPYGAPRGAPLRTNDLNFSYLVASVGQPTSIIPNASYAPNIVAPASLDPNQALPPEAKPSAVSLVAYYNG